MLRDPRALIGNSGFKTMPKDGCVEIGYSLLPAFHAHGYGSEAARALVAWAFTQSEVERVAAETLPHLRPSIRVMENCGMRFIGEGAEEEGMRTVHYEVTRGEFARS